MNSTKSRERIWGGQIRAAKMNAEAARQRATEATREADRAEAYAWSLRMEGYGGPAQPSPTIGQCLNSGLGWLEVECQAKPRAHFHEVHVQTLVSSTIFAKSIVSKVFEVYSPTFFVRGIRCEVMLGAGFAPFKILSA
jgi:hypothetical protein